MEFKTLQETIKQEIDDIEKGIVSKRVISFNDFKTKYAFIKNSVVVKVELINGKEATIDITDFFFNEKENK